MTMSTLNPNKSYGIIEVGENSSKLSLDFRYMFESLIKLGDSASIDSENFKLPDKYDLYICCTYDQKDAEKKLAGMGLVYKKDYFFAEDFFYLLDDWKNSRIAYRGSLKSIVFGYAARHGIIFPEDPHRDILTDKHLHRNINPVVQRFHHALYLIPGLLKAIPQFLAGRNNYDTYDHICFYTVSDAIRFKYSHPEAADKVITVEELKAHTMASAYMRALYKDRRQNSCACDAPFNTIWIGKGGTTRLCECPDYLDISCGNIGVTDSASAWDSPLAKIIRLSVINNSYTFCARNQCGKLSAANEHTSLIGRKEIKTSDHPLTVNVANDSVCNLHCPSCRKCIHAKNDDNEELEINTCTDALFESGWLEKADKLLVGGGGEAFLSKNYRRVIYGGSEKRNSIIIMTNGTLFNGSEWKKLEGKYEHISFLVSVDAAVKDTYEKLRCGGNYDSLMKNMDLLAELRKENKVDSVKVIMIVQRDNFEEIPAFIRWATAKGFDGVSLSHIRNWNIYDEKVFYDNISMFDKFGNMKPELAEVLKDPICTGSFVQMSW